MCVCKFVSVCRGALVPIIGGRWKLNEDLKDAKI